MNNVPTIDVYHVLIILGGLILLGLHIAAKLRRIEWMVEAVHSRLDTKNEKDR